MTYEIRFVRVIDTEYNDDEAEKVLKDTLQKGLEKLGKKSIDELTSDEMDDIASDATDELIARIAESQDIDPLDYEYDDEEIHEMMSKKLNEILDDKVIGEGIKKILEE